MDNIKILEVKQSIFASNDEQAAALRADLKAKKVMTVHHSKYALAHHRWDEPLRNEMNMAKNDSLHVLIPVIGEVVRWGE